MDEQRNPAASLTDDLLIEILRRLPIRSVCRCKCVSRSWRNLISDPAHRKKLPHTLTGFFYDNFRRKRFPAEEAHHFTNVTGKVEPFIFPSFSFLPVPSNNVELLDSCNGLLLCSCVVPGPRKNDENPPFHYAVCNPATKKWVMLPDSSRASGEACVARLGFDPAVSSHFHVLEYVVDKEDEYVTGVEIYSSKTASWNFKESEWGDAVMHSQAYDSVRSVFLNGFMHILMLSDDGIALVDMEGTRWRTIPVPFNGASCYIHQTQGRLHFLDVDDADAYKLSFWILEDHGTNEWTLKHSVRNPLLFQQKNLRFVFDYTVVTVHPECNLIYFVYGLDKTLMAYEMDHKEIRVIRNLGLECWGPYLPYVPLFSEALADVADEQ